MASDPEKKAVTGQAPGEGLLVTEDASSTTSKEMPTPDMASASETDLSSLRRVPDKIPIFIFLVTIAEFGERFAYRTITAPMQNYVQNPPHGALRPGALGEGQGTATALNYFFTCWSYLTPILGAYVADSMLGRYKTICLGTVTAFCGTVILFATSFPSSLEHGAGLPGLIVALFIVGLGSGGIKSNVAPLVAEQYRKVPDRIMTLKTGETVIVDADITVQNIYSRYYLFINFGSLSVIPAAWLELKVGFWAAFMLPVCIYGIAIVVVFSSRHKYVVKPVTGSILAQALRALRIAIRHGGELDAAKPSKQHERGNDSSTMPWTDGFVDELRRALVACRIFAVFPIFWICYGQTNSNLISQAATMTTYGIPNDMLGFFNPVTVVTMSAVMERIVYPFLRNHGIAFKPVTRITAGFICIACAMGLAAGIQECKSDPDAHRKAQDLTSGTVIYQSPPCFREPLAESCSDGGRIPSNVNVFLQLPIYFLTGMAEILAFVSGLEYAFTKAPQNMRSMVSALFLLTCAIGSALGITLSPTSTNPKVLVEYASLAGVMLVTTVLFWVVFAKYNRTEKEMNNVGEDSS